MWAYGEDHVTTLLHPTPEFPGHRIYRRLVGAERRPFDRSNNKNPVGDLPNGDGFVRRVIDDITTASAEEGATNQREHY
ncbi:hypothetical protein HYS30_03175 [Candidatus Peregrinibacteria bacterium]|nr:hypothetical protein [Candidatus Peregrinibacteria bacterium]